MRHAGAMAEELKLFPHVLVVLSTSQEAYMTGL